MPAAAAISEHPVTAHAVGEVIGQVLESLSEAPDLALLFVTPPHAGALEDAVGAVRATLGARVLLGCAARSIFGPRTEVEATAAVSLWAGAGFEAAPVAVPPGRLPGRDDWPAEPGFVPAALLLLADPHSVDAGSLLRWVDERFPGLPVIGAMASADRGPGGNRLASGSGIHSAGGVGALIGARARLSALVSQGCRPIGRPWAVTRAEGNMIYELAGRPALERLIDLAEDGLETREVALVNRGGLHLGVVVDEHRVEFGPEDFLIHNVLGGDRRVGAIAVDAEVGIGATVQYQLRDAATAGTELRALTTGDQAEGCLLFASREGPFPLFGRHHHEATPLGDRPDALPLAGMRSEGQFGPVRGRSFLHHLAVTAGLFGSAPHG